ncbi:MAG: DUF805 domain-containing protein [Ramlibacter sp.]
MSAAVNPYAPPEAAVADVGDAPAQTGPVNPFSWRGRIGRVRYLAYLMYSYLAVAAASFALAFVFAAVGLGSVAAIVPAAVLVPYAVYWLIITIQRSHDMGWNGWTSLLVLIPFVGFIWLFKAGTPERNRYGLPPPPNTTGVTVGAWLMPIVFVIGILAAIAIPVYQTYVMRAKAEQMK